MSQENVESIGRAYERWNQGDFEWATLVAPGFEYQASSAAPGLSGRHQGLEGFMRFLEQFWEEFDDAQVEPQELIDTGDGVLAVMTFRGRGRQSGVEVNMEVFQLWTFEHGKVIRGQGFADREEALEAAGLREQAAHDVVMARYGHPSKGAARDRLLRDFQSEAARIGSEAVAANP